MKLSIIGNGAFGTALALALTADETEVTLWGRDSDDIAAMKADRRTGRRLQGFDLPANLYPSDNLDDVKTEVVLLALPTQKLGAFLQAEGPRLKGRALVACCKGIDRSTGLTPTGLIERHVDDAKAMILTGPSFAVDIARRLPTALVLAGRHEGLEKVQQVLTRHALRIYATRDVIGAEMGGALKNVVALASGMSIGAGLGESARASVIARGFAEMTRFAAARGADPATLSGLSGLGDLVLTATSDKSRNYSAGLALGRGEGLPEGTIEGVATAAALMQAESGDDMPLTAAVHAVATGAISVQDAAGALLARPVSKE